MPRRASTDSLQASRAILESSLGGRIAVGEEEDLFWEWSKSSRKSKAETQHIGCLSVLSWLCSFDTALLFLSLRLSQILKCHTSSSLLIGSARKKICQVAEKRSGDVFLKLTVLPRPDLPHLISVQSVSVWERLMAVSRPGSNSTLVQGDVEG